MNTPLYSALDKFRKKNKLRLHIPGHKGKQMPKNPDFYGIDFTELSGTGNLYEEGEPFQQAQQLWADRFHFPHAQFLTGGSTQGVYSALALLCKKGDKVLLDRGSHRSGIHGMGLLGLEPVYMSRPWISESEVTGPYHPDAIAKYMDENPEIKVVFVTSPTYFGVMSPISSLADVIHQRGGKLIVDGAHGAHLPWLDINHFSSADIVTISAHKTLPALGQSAILLYRDIPPSVVREKVALFGTSSPSYPILASMDLARDWMDGDGMAQYKKTAKTVATLREILPSLSFPLKLDPTRLTVICHGGKKVAEELEQQGIYLEMSNVGHLVAVFTGMDEEEEIFDFAKKLLPYLPNRSCIPNLEPPKNLPYVKLTPEKTVHADKEQILLSESVGRVAASNLAPYPPGIPVVAMGEIITEESLAYLNKVGYEQKEVFVVAESYWEDGNVSGNVSRETYLPPENWYS